MRKLKWRARSTLQAAGVSPAGSPKTSRTRLAALIAVAIAGLGAPEVSCAQGPPAPGLYEVEVRIDLPNVQNAAPPQFLTRCITPEDLATGRAFFVLSDNPLKRCDLRDFRIAGNRATYRIECPGPNRGHAIAEFDVRGTAWRGTLRMNMGGKNMTMTETQVARRTGECSGDAR